MPGMCDERIFELEDLVLEDVFWEDPLAHEIDRWTICLLL